MRAVVSGIAGILFLALLCGCVDMEQEIHVNHDGSGKIVERVSVTARGYRLMQGLQMRTGETVTPRGPQVPQQ